MIIVCHYDEIALKGKNRIFFERILIENIKNKLTQEISGECFDYVKRISGRIIVAIREDFTDKNYSFMGDIFGITSFSIAQEEEIDMDKIKRVCWKMLKSRNFDTFRITASRSEKNFPLTSEGINREIGSYIVEKSKKRVKLKNPDIECFVELVNKRAFIYADVYRGQGGLPVGSAGKALVLISGGIDSPVASYFALKRGVGVDFIHFHSIPYTSQASNDKIIEIVRQLKKFQKKAKVYFVPLADIQKEIVLKCPEKFRVILYRRMMMRIAERVAKSQKYQALYTGEAVSQVASQTLENIAVINDATKIPILRPLIGFDKLEIIKKAQEIGTYEISILPHDDCCTRFMPKNPETRGKLEDVLLAEKNLDVQAMIENALNNTEIKLIK